MSRIPRGMSRSVVVIGASYDSSRRVWILRKQKMQVLVRLVGKSLQRESLDCLEQRNLRLSGHRVPVPLLPQMTLYLRQGTHRPRNWCLFQPRVSPTSRQHEPKPRTHHFASDAPSQLQAWPFLWALARRCRRRIASSASFVRIVMGARHVAPSSPPGHVKAA